MQLDVLDFKTGAVIRKCDLPESVSSFVNDVDYKYAARYLAHYLFVKKRKEFWHTASSKTISEVRGTTKKMYKQKGTGGARHGSKRAAQFVGGGIIFGPGEVTSPTLKINKKQRILARKLLLSVLLRNSLVRVVNIPKDSVSIKAKDVKNFLSSLIGLTKISLISSSSIYHCFRNFYNIHFDGNMIFNAELISKSDVLLIDADMLSDVFEVFNS